MLKPAKFLLVLVFLSALLGACSSRTLVVETDPPGALVYEDGRLLGTTPLEVPFTYGGERDYLILHDEGIETEEGRVGFRPVRLRQNTENFAFDTFPFDVFVTLSPVRIEDRHEISVKLERSRLVERMRATGDAWADALIERAHGLDARAQRALQETFPAVRPLKETLEEDESTPGDSDDEDPGPVDGEGSPATEPLETRNPDSAAGS